ncbi:MAG: DUF4190 domain-containing protein [Planctomycetaceae bacterium]|nr:DUF4190 domain-containing protein [Planctomycetaceae bacterium]
MSSQTLTPPTSEESLPRTAPAEDRTRPAPPRQTIGLSPVDRDEPVGEFSYRPVPVIAPVSVFLGLCGIIGLFNMVGLGIGLAGLVLGTMATLRIRGSNGEYSGQWLAMTGAVVSLVFLASGSALHAYTIATEVPDGFQRINFTRDISKKGFVDEDGETTIHPDVRVLDGQPIFLKGYMYPERQTNGLTEFVLVKDNLQCCFGGQPQLTDMMTVTMDKGMTVDFTTEQVSVAGIFRARAPQQSGALQTVYKIEASYFTPSKTSF